MEYEDLATLLKQNVPQHTYNDMRGTLAMANNQINNKTSTNKN